MVYTRKKTPIPFVPIAYTPPKRRRGKNLLEVYKENTESIPSDTIVIGEELTAVAMGKETESPVLDKEKASDVQELTATDPEFAQVFATEMVADIMSKCRIERATDPPRIPLCRILRNEAVRAVSRSDTRMREILRNDGYLPEKGKFVLSMKSSKGSDVPVTDSIRSRWDDYWIDVNEDFERELQESKEWKDLSGKMFLCWDGNHRTAGWTHAREQHVYKRNASVREWGFELVIIDFPTNNFPCEDDSEIPPWNLCTIPFVQACFSFGTLCLDDDGWLVSVYWVEQAKVIEKEARLKCLELFRTYFLHQDIPFGIVKDRMGSLACKVLLVSIWTRKGTSPSIQNILDKSKKGLPCQEQSLDHYFERGSKLHSSPSTPSRKSFEKSISFMEFIIENFCPKEGLVLDMLSGTGSALIASAILSRHCYGIDNDKLLVDHVKSSRLSALASSSSSKVERNLFEDSDDEVAAEDEEPM